jgi:hypothetical protein
MAELALRRILLSASWAFLILAGCSSSDRSYCPVAQTGYRNALGEVNQTLGKYASCVGRSSVVVDCAAEFDALRSAQSNLDKSVSDVRDYCAGS